MQSSSKGLKAHKTNMDQYYECRIYDKNIDVFTSRDSEHAPCPVVVMSRHQGFQWNDDLFVNAYRRSAGYESHKSSSLQTKDDKVTSNKVAQKQKHQEQNSEMPADVIDIDLSEADCDVWP